MTVQDDGREQELSRVFGLTWDPAHTRDGVDALLDVTVGGQKYRFEVEVKSTTGGDIGTARDCGAKHIARWRNMFFVVGFYSKEAKPKLQRCLCLTPVDMVPWIASLEARIDPDLKLASLASKRLTFEDLFEVCGEHSTYSVEQARALLKMQWSVAQYKLAVDTTVDGEPRISQAGMLEVLKRRATYLASRGATLNNPKITTSYLEPFFGTDRLVPEIHEAAIHIRRIAADFLLANPGHPSALLRS